MEHHELHFNETTAEVHHRNNLQLGPNDITKFKADNNMKHSTVLLHLYYNKYIYSQQIEQKGTKPQHTERRSQVLIYWTKVPSLNKLNVGPKY